MTQPIFTITCHEPEGEFERSVYLLELTPQNLSTVWKKAKDFPTLFGRELSGINEFADLFLSYQADGSIKANGLIFCVADDKGDIIGVFYITNVLYENNQILEADVHYIFFDRRHRGRVPLTKKMIRYVFEEFGFRRLNARVPLYSTKFVRHFISNVGFQVEGRKRKASFYDGKWFDDMLYGILREDVLTSEDRINDGSE